MSYIKPHITTIKQEEIIKHIKVQACMSLSCFASGYGDPCFLGQEPWFSSCTTDLYSAYCHEVGSYDVTACDPMIPPTAPHGVNNIIDPL